MEEGEEDRITAALVAASVKAAFDRHLDVDDLEEVALAFQEGMSVETGEEADSAAYESIADQLTGLEGALERLAEEPAARPSAIEFILEGLHLHKLLNKRSAAGRTVFTG